MMVGRQEFILMWYPLPDVRYSERRSCFGHTPVALGLRGEEVGGETRGSFCGARQFR